MNRDRKKFRLYAVTDSRQLHGRSLPQAVEEVIKGGATMIQLREKDAKDSRLLKLAGDVLSVTDRYAVPLIINDRPDIALQCGAAGVHIGQQDGSVRQIRRMIEKRKFSACPPIQKKKPSGRNRTVPTTSASALFFRLPPSRTPFPCPRRLSVKSAVR